MEWRREGEGVWSAVCVVNMKASRSGIVDWLPDLSLCCAVYVWSTAGWAVWSTTDQKEVSLCVSL